MMTPRTPAATAVSIFALVCVLLFSPASSAKSAERTVKRNVATVLFSTIGGAVLGLSTLSFYGEPQEHTNNISLGALVGFVGGVGYVVYDSTRSVSPAPYSYSYLNEESQMKRALASSAKASVLVRFQFDF